MFEIFNIPKYTPELQQWLKEHVLIHPKYKRDWGPRVLSPKLRDGYPECKIEGCNEPGVFWLPYRKLSYCSTHCTVRLTKRYQFAWHILRTEMVYVKLKQANLIHNLD